MAAAFIACNHCFVLGSARVRGFVSAADMHLCGANGIRDGVSLCARVRASPFVLMICLSLDVRVCGGTDLCGHLP